MATQKIREYQKEYSKNNKEAIANNGRKWEKKNNHNSLIYFIYCDGYIKIGRTVCLKRRFKAIRFTHPLAPSLELLKTIDGGEELEMELHEKFKEYRSSGAEWFKDCEEIRNYILE